MKRNSNSYPWLISFILSGQKLVQQHYKGHTPNNSSKETLFTPLSSSWKFCIGAELSIENWVLVPIRNAWSPCFVLYHIQSLNFHVYIDASHYLMIKGNFHDPLKSTTIQKQTLVLDGFEEIFLMLVDLCFTTVVLIKPSWLIKIYTQMGCLHEKTSTI